MNEPTQALQDTSRFRNGWINIIGPRGPITFKGKLLGETTSFQDRHMHEGRRFADRGQRCYGCRWSEYKIFIVTELDQRTRVAYGTDYDGRYLVCSFGQTVVPHEDVYRRVDATNSPAEVVELLTTRKYGHKPNITAAAARLMARVSDIDRDLQEAWDNRVVL